MTPDGDARIAPGARLCLKGQSQQSLPDECLGMPHTSRPPNLLRLVSDTAALRHGGSVRMRSTLFSVGELVDFRHEFENAGG